jgi:hypothetical protein
MHFFRDCRRGLVVPTFDSTVLVCQPSGAHPLAVVSAALRLLA